MNITVKDGDLELEFKSMAQAMEYALRTHYSRREVHE